MAIALHTAAEALRSYPEPLQASLRHLVTLMVYIDPAEPKHPVPGDKLALSASGIIASQQDLAIDMLRLVSEGRPLDDRVASGRVVDLVVFPLLAATFGACTGALPDDMQLALSDFWDPPTAT